VSVNREKKESQIQELRSTFSRNNTFYLLNYVNIPVSKSSELRRQLRDNDCSLKVVKNRLAVRALLEGFPEDLKESFQGPTAIAFTDENPIVLARLLKDFSAQYRILKVKAGIVEGDFLSQDRFQEIASLSSRNDLVAKLGYLIAYPLTQLLRTIQAPISTLGSMMSQLRDKKK
jgi:large subunit ribosomal protein L10